MKPRSRRVAVSSPVMVAPAVLLSAGWAKEARSAAEKASAETGTHRQRFKVREMLSTVHQSLRMYCGDEAT